MTFHACSLCPINYIGTISSLNHAISLVQSESNSLPILFRERYICFWFFFDRVVSDTESHIKDSLGSVQPSSIPNYHVMPRWYGICYFLLFCFALPSQPLVSRLMSEAFLPDWLCVKHKTIEHSTALSLLTAVLTGPEVFSVSVVKSAMTNTAHRMDTATILYARTKVQLNTPSSCWLCHWNYWAIAWPARTLVISPTLCAMSQHRYQTPVVCLNLWPSSANCWTTL